MYSSRLPLQLSYAVPDPAEAPYPRLRYPVCHQFAGMCPGQSRQGQFDSLLEEFAVKGWVLDEHGRLRITHEGRKALGP